jgi:hypothetical protein
MNAIDAPLPVGSRGSAVTNLQDALLALLKVAGVSSDKRVICDGVGVS